MGRTSLVPSPTSPARLVPRSFIRHLHARHSLHLTFQRLSRVLWSAHPIISMALADVSTTTTTTSDSDDAIEEVSDSLQSRSAAGQLAESVVSAAYSEAENQRVEKELRKKKERTTYLFAAVGSTMGITFLAAGAVFYRFTWQTQGAAVPLSEIWAIFSLAVGASVGMEYWARWAHEVLWHDSLWGMHESHHRPRDGGPFELNDIFAVINAVPAIALMAYGFFHRGFVPGLCFGAGLGITVFGMAYMFVHDGLVHCRFPVGPIANVPYLQKVAAAHQLHHANKFKGVPYGLFLGPQELECQPGGAEELEKMIQIRTRLHSSKNQ